MTKSIKPIHNWRAMVKMQSKVGFSFVVISFSVVISSSCSKEKIPEEGHQGISPKIITPDKQKKNPAPKPMVNLEIQKNIILLRSKDMNERRRGIDELESRMKDPIEIQSIDGVTAELLAYLSKWDENSYKAALLIGLLNDQNAIVPIRAILEDRKNIISKMDDRYVLVPRMKNACLKALVRLGEEDAKKEVSSLVRSKQIADISNGIDCISYAAKKDMFPILTTLLKDKRDASNIAPSGGSYYLRICDLALNAINAHEPLALSFLVQRGLRYSDSQLDEAERLATNRARPVPSALRKE